MTMEGGDRRILVTGNMGYVGPVLVRHLRRRFPGAVLIGYDNALFAHCLTAPGPLPEIALDVQHFGDTRDIRPEVLEGVDTVVHLAAISNDPMGSRFEQATDDVNRRATLRLAELASLAGVKRFVFASSCSVYGSAADGAARRETDPLGPITAYARSKIASEEGLRQARPGSMAITCLRFATACGMSPRLRLDLVLNDFVAGAVAFGEIAVLSDGTPWRPLIHVADMARAIEWALVRPVDDAQPFLVVNAGSEDGNYQVRQLAECVAAQVPGTRVSVNADAPPDRRSYRVDFSLFRALAPDHQPRVGLPSAILGLVDGLRAIGFPQGGTMGGDPPQGSFPQRDFRNSSHMRLPVLAGHVDSGRLDRGLRWVPGQAA